MSKMRSGVVFTLLACIAQVAAAQDAQQHSLGGFKLVSESLSGNASLAGTSTRLSRTYRLENGDYVELVHGIRPDGSLELDASQQSGDTLSRLDTYCSRIGGVASRTGVATFSRETRTLLSCTGSSPGSRAKQKEHGASLQAPASLTTGATPSI